MTTDKVIEWVRENIKKKKNFSIVINNFLIYYYCNKFVHDDNTVTTSEKFEIHDLKRHVCLKLCVRNDMKDFIEITDKEPCPKEKQIQVDDVIFHLANYNIIIVGDNMRISINKG